MVPAMQRSRVDFPRPLAATSPIRSPGLTTRFSAENSGALSVTPRLRRVISVMIVLWSCRRSQHPEAYGLQRKSVSARRLIQTRTRTEKSRDAQGHEGQTRDVLGECPV